MKTIEEKRELFLDMQEHPENYSEQELQAMLDDPEMADDINAFEMLRQAERYNASLKNHYSLHATRYTLYKVAAMFIGVIMLGGIAYAAIRFMNERTQMPIDNETTIEMTMAKATSESTAVEKTDSITGETIVQFDDAELGDILSAMANYYHMKIVYEDEATKSIKLFLKWNKEENIDKTLEILNAYDRINIEHRGDELIVK